MKNPIILLLALFIGLFSIVSNEQVVYIVIYKNKQRINIVEYQYYIHYQITKIN